MALGYFAGWVRDIDNQHVGELNALAAAGLPLIAAVFDPSRTIYVALAVASGSVLLSPLTLAILEANKSSAGGSQGSGLVFRAVGRSLLNPVVLSPIIGIAIAFLRIPLADAIRDAFVLIGQATGGVALFLTGLILSSQPLLLNRNVVLFGLRYDIVSHEAGSTLIASTILSALTLAAALILTAAN